MRALRVASGLFFLLVACSEARSAPPPPAPVQAAPPSAASEAAPPAEAVYPWGPTATDRLDARFPPPAGFVRAAAAPKSFASFLRTLPLKPAGAPVVDYRGTPLYARGAHPAIAAVVDLDVGTRDLQQCADSIIRLHAEWRYGRGERDLAYRAVSGTVLDYRGFVAGDRAVPSGNDISIRRVAGPRTDDHAALRVWLDDVFGWAGTASLQREGRAVGSLAAIEAGDFFVMSGSPFGHAVLVLDVAKDAAGRTALLLGQSYMPAQSFHVLRDGGSAWFVVEPDQAAVTTPFWKPFPVSTLRRFG